MSIYAIPTTTFQAVLTGAPTGLTGTLGVRVLNLAVTPPSTAIARTTSGIEEEPDGSGIYNTSGTRLANTGQITSSTNTVQMVTGTITGGGYQVTAGTTYYIAHVSDSTPSITGSVSSPALFGTAVGTWLFGTVDVTTPTALPSTITMPTVAATAGTFTGPSYVARTD